MSVRIGNTAIQIKSNSFNWVFYVQGEAISEVVIELHPTFRNPVKTLKGPKFEFSASGWGTFPIAVRVSFEDGRTDLRTEWHLSFEQNDQYTVITPPPPAQPVALDPSFNSTMSGLAIGAQDAFSEDIDRDEFAAMLHSKLSPFLEHDNPMFFHGRGYLGSIQPPEVMWASDKKPRNDHDAPDWLTATEYRDMPAVMDEKCKLLAQLLRASQKTVVYSGAGISVPACIGQAAAGSSDKGMRSTNALPTKTHYALGLLARRGYIHGWVQQNHDGLPQKAGFPQEHINEVHGSWYDCSNPVVKYSGTLKGPLYQSMVDDADTADLVIVVGTSLGGLNADQVANKCMKRSLRGAPYSQRGALGTVIINLQQTTQDGGATLRMFGTTDVVLSKVLLEMGLAQVRPSPSAITREKNGYMYDTTLQKYELLLQADQDPNSFLPLTPAQFPDNPRVLVPYDRNGNRSETERMWLDLRDGARVKLTDGHNVQGAKQPMYMHIGTKTPDKYKGTVKRPGPGVGHVVGRLEGHSAYRLSIEGVVMKLGVWWLEAAQRGGPEQLPVVNVDPEMVTA